MQRAVDAYFWLGTIAVSETHTQVEWNTKNEILIGPVMNEQVLKERDRAALAGDGHGWTANGDRLDLSPQGKVVKVEVSLYTGATIAQARPFESNIERAGVR